MPRRNRNRKTARSATTGSQLAQSQFLKCAFAPVDFNNEIPGPIPDASGARVVTKRHKAIAPSSTIAGKDTYYIVAPTPGIAAYVAFVDAGTIPNGTTVFNPIPYQDTDTLMPDSNCNLNFTSFRHVSNYVEFVPTINATSWSGSITCWKAPMSVYTASDPTLSELNGIAAVQQPNESMFVAGNNLGLYAFATQMGPWTYTPMNSTALTYTSVPPTSPKVQRVLGWGNLETIIIRITGNFSYSVKIGCCVEYTCGANSALYEYSRLNNDLDINALMMYKQIASRLPVAVNYFENAQFWDRVLQIIKQLSGALSVVPGPVGMTSQGVNLIANAISLM